MITRIVKILTAIVAVAYVVTKVGPLLLEVLGHFEDKQQPSGSPGPSEPTGEPGRVVAVDQKGGPQ